MVEDLNSESKNYPMNEFRAIFFDFIDFGPQVRVCKKRSFLNIICISKCMGFYINLGCRFEFRTQKLPYERISGNFSDFINFGHQVRVCEKRSVFNISCISEYMGFYINLGCRFEFRMQKLPYERILGIFSDFIDFGHQVRVCKKRSFLNITCNSKYMGLT